LASHPISSRSLFSFLAVATEGKADRSKAAPLKYYLIFIQSKPHQKLKMNVKYSRIDEAELKQGKVYVIKRAAFIWLSLLATCIVGLSLSLFIYSLFLRRDGQRLSKEASHLNVVNCGSSPIEARERGCHFDIMSFIWSAPACFDAGLMDEFTSKKTWAWYRRDGSEVPIEEVRKGELTNLFVSWEFHLTHCTFMWRKMHRAIKNGAPIDSYIGNYNHTMHCGMEILSESTPFNETNTMIFIKYPTCESY
jgi:hypothetical protein